MAATVFQNAYRSSQEAEVRSTTTAPDYIRHRVFLEASNEKTRYVDVNIIQKKRKKKEGTQGRYRKYHPFSVVVIARDCILA